MKQPWYRRWFARDEPPQVVLFPQLPPELRHCPRCKQLITIWRTYADGQIRCVPCGDKERKA